MKAVFRLATALALLTVLHVARAADVSGVWKGSFDFQGSSIPLTLTLKVDGAAVTGTVEGLPTTPAEIHDGKIAGDAVTFWVNSDYEGQTYKLVYKGTVTEGKIAFSFGTEDGTWSTDLTVKKEDAGAPAAVPAAADVSGDWKGSFDFNGTEVPVVFHLKGGGAAVTGTIDGLGPAPVEIHEGKLVGDALTFWVNTDYEGQTYTLMYNGKVTASKIDFSFGTADSSWGSTVSATKVQ